MAAIVAVLLSGTAATAARMITGSQIKDNSVTGKDIRNRSLTGQDIKKKSISMANLSAGVQRLIRQTGNGPAGPQGPQGPRGAQGPAGPAGPAGQSFDPKKVTSQTSILFGFTPWYDSGDSGVVSFTDEGLKLSAEEDRIGVNLPINRGTSLSTLESISYSQTGRAALGIELYYRGGLFENGAGNDPAEPAKAGRYRGDYTTILVEPTEDGDVTLDDDTAVRTTGAIRKADGDVVIAAGPTTWGAVKDAIASGGAGVNPSPADEAAEKANLNAALILHASLRTIASAGDTTPSSATISQVAIKLRNAEKAVSYSFSGE